MSLPKAQLPPPPPPPFTYMREQLIRHLSGILNCPVILEEKVAGPLQTPLLIKRAIIGPLAFLQNTLKVQAMSQYRWEER